ncbi:hypothetical protein ACMUMQ_01140 [Marinomonas sp. 2405UD66-6]
MRNNRNKWQSDMGVAWKSELTDLETEMAGYLKELGYEELGYGA